MNHKSNFFLIDLLNILPIEIELFIQAPSLMNVVIEKMLKASDQHYFKSVQFDELIKKEFVGEELKSSFSVYIQNIEIKKNGILLFKGYDGVEYGVISKKISIPVWFKEKYVPEICLISADW
ncbi:hypothetical protein [Aquiflexum gelatinilyticum]|uniref:Uncharacterized protein n=1 Tax=Aquiflexum gelatinilyticum TaxID=2961943 RepID=A0A9X2SZ36_9BACT|nr:hypothetical protein [Aquiflexum gelatinilyticum]MCR9016202.1 hypothetical protein [Aquiflexum gelatinilyticum]